MVSKMVGDIDLIFSSHRKSGRSPVLFAHLIEITFASMSHC